jgi:hypothetical protein
MAHTFQVRTSHSSSIQGIFPRSPSAKILRLAGLISIFAATGNVVADLILQYTPQGPTGNIAFLAIASWRVFTGLFLGVFTIPLEIVGYWLVCTLMLEHSPRLFRVLFWIMAYNIIIGTVFHGTFASTIFVMQAASATSGATQSSLLALETLLNFVALPLSVFFFVLYLVMWSIFIVSILPKPSPFPKWCILLTPAFLSLLITALYASHIIPLLGNLLYPTVLSLPHLVFYIFCTILVWRKVKLEDEVEALSV